MKTVRWPAVLLGLLGLFGVCASAAQKARTSPGADDARVLIEGTWRGHSVCEDKNSPCRDEINVYRFSAVTGKPGVFLVTAGKVVDGKEIVMGSGEWKYDEAKGLVQSAQPRIRLMIDGKKMAGALRLPDGMVYRRIYLEKQN